MIDGSAPPDAYKNAGTVVPTAPSTTSEKMAGSTFDLSKGSSLASE